MTHNAEHVIIHFAKSAAATVKRVATAKVSAFWLIVPFIAGAVLF